MSQYITDLQVSLDKTQEDDLRAQGFTPLKGDLNKGTTGNPVYLWYKKSSDQPITRIQFSFIEGMDTSLKQEKYTKIEKNLNEGTTGDTIYLWFFKGSLQYDVPIVDLSVTTEAKDEVEMLRFGWERLACDLNRNAKGDWIHLWVMREKPAYICDITAIADYQGEDTYFNSGYIRVDEDTDRDAKGSRVFIMYRQDTNPKEAITKLQISTSNEEKDRFRVQGYKEVIMDLNHGTEGKEVLLWYKKEGDGKPIKAVTPLLNPDAVKAYKDGGITVIDKNLNEGNVGMKEYLAYHQ
ncbi:uncharacterized protein KZ484_003491 [Pholidichthys leucotaenia]